MALNITITDQGRAEIINAQNTGTTAVTIAAIALGAAQYTPSNKNQTALIAEVKRVTSIAGAAVADDTIHVVAKDESNASYNVGEFGLISDKGTLLAFYSQPAADGWILQKAPASTLLLATDIILESLTTALIEFGDVSFINPPATTTTPGITQLNNTLTSTSTSQALAAAQGKKLQDEKVPNTRQVIAGNGLTGGGALSADRTLTLGTPGTITNSSTNSVSSNGHTHELTLPKASKSAAGITQLNNTLTSTSTDQALTAAQGKKLQDEKLDTSRVQSNATDTTVGKLLTPGAFGLGNSVNLDIPDGDANALNVSGVYRCASSVVGMPYASLWQLQHWQQGTGVAVQIAQRAGSDNNELHVRTRNTSLQWTNWAKLYHSENLATQSNIEDNSAGKLLQVGAFGLGSSSISIVSSVGDVTSLDDITTTGFRRVVSADVSEVNGPATAGAGVVLTITYSSSNRFQLYASVTGAARTWTRYRNSAGWFAWVEQYNSGNLSPVETSRQVTAGNGLTGGGTLAADRSLALGTPGTISTSSSNSVSASSHTHALTLPSASTSVAGITQLNNTLTSTSTSQALTAAQGKVLNECMIGSKSHTWKDLTASRTLATTYTNTTGAPLMLNVSFLREALNITASITVQGSIVARSDRYGDSLSAIVPIDASYSVNVTNSSLSLTSWRELSK